MVCHHATFFRIEHRNNNISIILAKHSNLFKVIKASVKTQFYRSIFLLNNKKHFNCKDFMPYIC